MTSTFLPKELKRLSEVGAISMVDIRNAHSKSKLYGSDFPGMLHQPLTQPTSINNCSYHEAIKSVRH